MDQQPAITADRLKVSFKKVEVLKGVSFTVRKGTIFALLGANGAGKTTAINILTTLLRADSGQATVGGNDVVKNADAVRGCISLTGQFAAVDDVLTARENLMLIAELRHVKNPGKVAAALLQQFDLIEAADRRVLNFSGGMRRRLDIAMGLIGNPSVVFLDEPTTGLDPESRNLMWDKIRQLATDGKTVFLTTQYLEEADRLADKIAILANGKIVAEGTADELKKLSPQSHVELRFADDAQLSSATEALAEYQTGRVGDTLVISTDGGVSDVARMFRRLEAARLMPTEFAQKQPTLDDAFLKIINQHKEAK